MKYEKSFRELIFNEVCIQSLSEKRHESGVLEFRKKKRKFEYHIVYCVLFVHELREIT